MELIELSWREFSNSLYHEYALSSQWLN